MSTRVAGAELPRRILLAEADPAPAASEEAAREPLVVKDLLDTAGLETTYGSRIFAGHVPARSAAAVERAETAGYRVSAKANLHEFAWGITSENEHFGWVPNPLDPARTPGGSSGGSAAAIAAGIARVAIGTDTGGSIRIPSACCGTVGFKPSWGRVPVTGCFPLAPSFDTVGAMGADVASCVGLATALDPELDPPELGALSELRIGVAWLDRAEPTIAARVAAIAARIGARTVGLETGSRPGTAVFGRESLESHAGMFPEREAEYGENVRTKLRNAMAISDADLNAAERERELYRQRWADLFERERGLDLLIAPTLPWVAPRAGLGDLTIRERQLELTYPANAVGAPAFALPCGAAEDGLPASIQVMAMPGDDSLVIAAARLIELATKSR
ncbi:amidase [Thermoleophilia bacterium SCSIO 60948]|nr:amidase [Thermoleophilia bacterium SCSIO 60948]